ncbi:MAG TPA: uroporphyrinogen decarboxylase family protein [Pelovirga sp.]|nr:uroporphyrinogen decarboxylase family protein [Pelovirga sp.]
MTAARMTSLERVLTTLDHREPDRVPFFLLLTTHGAKELGLSIEDYFSRPEHVVEGQLRLREKYRHDCYYMFFYAALELTAWGGEVIFYADGPPNAGPPIIHDPAAIKHLQVPDIAAAAGLQKALQAIAAIKQQAADEVPVLGVVMSPFSLPVMQMGFAAYLNLIYEQPELFWKLMALNQEFCVAWANAQLAAGATAIVYFDPVSSPTIITPADYRTTGYQVACRTLSRINGPTATHLASGTSLPIIDDLVATGSQAVGVSGLESLAEIKDACRNRLTVIGNLNGIEMARWSPAEAQYQVQQAISAAAKGGGFILADNHGEIPWQVSEDVLLAIRDAVERHGHYPLPNG